MSQEDLSRVSASLSERQKELLTAFVPFNPLDDFSFESFSRMTSLSKIKECHAFLIRLRSSGSPVLSIANRLLATLLEELSCEEVDWALINVVIFSVHVLVIQCPFEVPNLTHALRAIASFANRWSEPLAALDGPSHTITAIMFHIFTRVPPVVVFAALLDGMSQVHGTILADSFYCKCWMALSNQLGELTQPEDAEVILAMAQERYREFGNDIRGRLCLSLSRILTNGTPVQGPQDPPSLPSEPPSPVVDSGRTPPSPLRRSPADPAQIADLRNRFNALRERWK
jgi:hypothetical protein